LKAFAEKLKGGKKKKNDDVHEPSERATDSDDIGDGIRMVLTDMRGERGLRAIHLHTRGRSGRSEGTRRVHGTGTEGDNVAGQAAGGIGADEDSTGTAVRTSRQKEGSLRGVFYIALISGYPTHILILHSYLDIPLISGCRV
jgi:hypothetical protein